MEPPNPVLTHHDEDEDAPTDRAEYTNPPERDGSDPPDRMKCRGCEHRWMKPADEQARRCPACGGHRLVQLPTRRGELFTGFLAALGYVGLTAIAVVFIVWKGADGVPLVPGGSGAASSPSPADEEVEETHDLAGLDLVAASALQGGRHRFRVVRDSDPDEVNGCVCFDCAGPDDVHRSVRFRRGCGGENVDEVIVEARVRVLRHAGWGPFEGFAELRLVDAVEVE